MFYGLLRDNYCYVHARECRFGSFSLKTRGFKAQLGEKIGHFLPKIGKNDENWIFWSFLMRSCLLCYSIYGSSIKRI